MKMSTLGLLLALVAWPIHTWAQDDDGKTEAKKRAKVIRTWVQEKDGDGKASETIPLEGKNYKVIIVGEDGKQKELNLAGGGSVTITRSSERTETDGQVEEKSSGKAIFRTPDGQEHEIELSNLGDVDGMMPRMFKFRTGDGGEEQDLAVLAQPLQAIGKYYIGIVCQPVEEEQRKELRLAENVGLVIEDVTEDSPAAKAGIKQGDILIYANDDETGDVEDVVKVVQAAGEKGDEIALTIVRDGDEKKVTVRPAERPEMPAELNFEGDLGELKERLKDLDMKFDFAIDPEQMKRSIVIPKIMGLDKEHMAELHEQMAEAHKELAQAREELAKAQAEISQEFRNARKEFQAQMQEAHQQLEKALKELHSAQEKKKDD